MKLMRSYVAIARTLRRTASLGVGQALSSLIVLINLALVGRYLGLEALGYYGLALTVSQYVLLGTDFGLKSIGARLIAVIPQETLTIIRLVQLRRYHLALPAFGMASLYAMLGPIPDSSRWVVLLAVLAVLPSVFALDWAMWGSERFLWLGGWRAAVALLGFPVVLFFTLVSPNLSGVALSSSLGWLVGAVISWKISRTVATHKGNSALARPEIMYTELRWSNILMLGLAISAYQFVQTIDVLMLGALSTVDEVGTYSSVFRPLIMLLGIFYLFNQVLYSTFARMRDIDSSFRKIFVLCAAVFTMGIMIALAGQFLAPQFVILAYGELIEASVDIFRKLIWIIPFDLVCTLLGAAFLAWGKGHWTTWVFLGSLALKVCLNFFLIPLHGALGACTTTLVTYGLQTVTLLSLLLWKRAYVKLT